MLIILLSLGIPLTLSFRIASISIVEKEDSPNIEKEDSPKLA